MAIAALVVAVIAIRVGPGLISATPPPLPADVGFGTAPPLGDAVTPRPAGGGSEPETRKAPAIRTRLIPERAVEKKVKARKRGADADPSHTPATPPAAGPIVPIQSHVPQAVPPPPPPVSPEKPAGGPDHSRSPTSSAPLPSTPADGSEEFAPR